MPFKISELFNKKAKCHRCGKETDKAVELKDKKYCCEHCCGAEQKSNDGGEPPAICRFC